jgi:hypothetical protein
LEYQVIPFFIATNSFRNRLLTEQQRELPLGLKHNEIRSLCLILTSLKIGNQFPDLRDTKYRIWVETKIAAVSPGNNYLRAVMQDKFGTTDWDTLTQPQFIQLYATLRNRRKSKSSSSSSSFSSSAVSVSENPF